MASKKAGPKAPSLSLGGMADKIYALSGEIAKIEAQKKEVEEAKRDLENQLIAAMGEAGTDIVRGETASCSLSESVRPQIADFEALTKFIKRTGDFQLFEKRIGANAYREVKERLGNKPVPGLTEFTQTKLSVRKV